MKMEQFPIPNTSPESTPSEEGVREELNDIDSDLRRATLRLRINRGAEYLEENDGEALLHFTNELNLIREGVAAIPSERISLEWVKGVLFYCLKTLRGLKRLGIGTSSDNEAGVTAVHTILQSITSLYQTVVAHDEQGQMINPELYFDEDFVRTALFYLEALDIQKVYLSALSQVDTEVDRINERARERVAITKKQNLVADGYIKAAPEHGFSDAMYGYASEETQQYMVETSFECINEHLASVDENSADIQSERPLKYEAGVKLLAKAISADPYRVGEFSVDSGLEKLVGFPAEKLVDAWVTFIKNNDPEKNHKRIRDLIEQNIYTLVSLREEIGTEGLKKLYEVFGINHFGRYPIDMLVEQANFGESDESPKKDYYGVVIFPFSDHNGAFYQDKDILDGLRSDLGDRYSVIIAETEHRFDATKKLLAINKKYGSDDIKADFLIVGGHGTKDSLMFGDPRSTLYGEEMGYKYTKDMFGQSTHAEAGNFPTDKLLSPDAPIILLSCSTGQDNGLAERAASFFGRDTSAPSVATNLKSIGISLNSSDRLMTMTPKFGNRLLDEDFTRTYKSEELD